MSSTTLRGRADPSRFIHSAHSKHTLLFAEDSLLSKRGLDSTVCCEPHEEEVIILDSLLSGLDLINQFVQM